MAVPAHDERDFVFARKYNLMWRKVSVIPENTANSNGSLRFLDDGFVMALAIDKEK